MLTREDHTCTTDDDAERKEIKEITHGDWTGLYSKDWIERMTMEYQFLLFLSHFPVRAEVGGAK